MAKRKQEVVNSNLASMKSPALPLAVAGRDNPVMAAAIEVSQDTGICRRKFDEHPMKEQKEVKVSSRRTQFIALSKVVNKAFTGWTIKTQRQV